MPGVVVKGASISEKTYVDSVTSLFSDILPQNSRSSKSHNRNSGGSSTVESYEPIAWAHLCNRQENVNQDRITSNELFSLVIGYSTGIQVWSISEHGNATETFSLRCGPSSVFKEIPFPDEKLDDKFCGKRPIAAYTACPKNGVKLSFKSLIYISLLSGEQLHSLNFTTSIQDIVPNSKIIVVTFYDRLAVFDTGSLEHKFSITSCYPSVSNCVSITDNWLCYADRNLIAKLQSGGGVVGDVKQQSYAASIVKSASYGLNVGLNLLSQYTVGNAANGAIQNGSTPSPIEGSPLSSATSSPLLAQSSFLNSSHVSSNSNLSRNGAQFGPADGSNSGAFHISNSRNANVSSCVPGVVTVINLSRVPKRSEKCKHVTVGTSETNHCAFEEIVAHFCAHFNEALVAIKMSTRGLMSTASEMGRVFNVFKIHPHPWTSSQCAVHHLYGLKRGDTVAKINHISMSDDLRWVTACSNKGTVHLFAINPYGGQPSARTHCSDKMVNKEDKFYCSAGLDDVKPAATSFSATAAHLSSSPNAMPGSPSFESHKLMSTGGVGRSSASFRAVLNGTVSHPRIPPYPLPIHLESVAQIKAPTISVPAACIPSGLNLNEMSVTSIFAAPCFNLDAFQLEYTPSSGNDFSMGPLDISPPDDSYNGSNAFIGFSLYSFFATAPGILLETSVRVGRDVNNKDALEVTHSPSAQWKLTRCTSWKEVKPSGGNSSSHKSDEYKNSNEEATGDTLYHAQKSHDSVKTLTTSTISNDDRVSPSLLNNAAGETLSEKTKDSRTTSVNSEGGKQHKSQKYNIWMSQVEMNTHAPPHRRLWMGPQFSFKTILNPNDSNSGVSKQKQNNQNSKQSSPKSCDGISTELNSSPAVIDIQSGNSNPAIFANNSPSAVHQEDIPSVEAKCSSPEDLTSSSIALSSVPQFQSIDKLEIDQLRMTGFISPIGKNRQLSVTHTVQSLSPPTPNSSIGASPPDLYQGSGDYSSLSPGGAFNNAPNQVKSKPVPINLYNNGSSSNSGAKLRRGDRYKSDSGDSISSNGSTGNSYPFYIEVGSGDFERQRNLLVGVNNNNSNVSYQNYSNFMPNNATAHFSSPSGGGGGGFCQTTGNENVDGAPSHMKIHHPSSQGGGRSRPSSTTSFDDFSSWGEDTNLDDAINSIDSDSNQLTNEDFHDAIEDVTTPSTAKNYTFSSPHRHRNNHLSRDNERSRSVSENECTQVDLVAVYSNNESLSKVSGVGVADGGGSSNRNVKSHNAKRKNLRWHKSHAANGGVDGHGVATAEASSVCDIEGMLAEAMADHHIDTETDIVTSSIGLGTAVPLTMEARPSSSDESCLTDFETASPDKCAALERDQKQPWDNFITVPSSEPSPPNTIDDHQRSLRSSSSAENGGGESGGELVNGIPIQQVPYC